MAARLYTGSPRRSVERDRAGQAAVIGCAGAEARSRFVRADDISIPDLSPRSRSSISTTEDRSMPTARPVLQASRRDVTGKAVARLRREGRLPAVVFGRGLDSENLQLDAHEFELLRRHSTGNTLIDLKLDGTTPRPVLVSSVQVHPVTQRPLHVDLFVVRMTEELVVDVPLQANGVAPAIDVLNGVLLHALDHVRIRALPDHLPESIPYSVESLVDFDAAIHVRDLTIPSDVTLLNDPDELVAKVERPRIEIEEVPEAPEEGEEGAEGEEAAEGAAGEAESAAGSSEESADR